MISATNFPLNCGSPTSNFKYTYSKRKISDRTFIIVPYEIQRFAQIGNYSTTTTNDQTFELYPNVNSYTDIGILIEPLLPNKSLNISLEVENNNILTVAPNNVLSYVSNGTTYVKGISSEGEISRIPITTRSFTQYSNLLFKEWVSGSLAKNIRDNIITLLLNKNYANKNLFLNDVTGSPASYSRNNENWASQIDFTCVSPWNSTGNNMMGGTLISPRHVLFCRHLGFYPSVGSSIKFVTNNNTIITRTITNMSGHPNFRDYPYFYPDITIGILDSDVPNTITPAKILPSNYNSYLPSNSNMYLSAVKSNIMGCITINQFKNIGLASLNLLADLFYLAFPENNYQNFYRGIILYDSGSPAFVIINGEAVLLGTFTFGGAGRGTFISNHIAAINTMMSQLGGGYQLTEVNLSSFTSY